MRGTEEERRNEENHKKNEEKGMKGERTRERQKQGIEERNGRKGAEKGEK
jgi:hypothetical protein